MAHLLLPFAIVPVLIAPLASAATPFAQSPAPAPAAPAAPGRQPDDQRSIEIPPVEGGEAWSLAVMPLPASDGQPVSHAFLFVSERKDCATPPSFRILFAPDTGSAIPKRGALLSRQREGERCVDGLATVFGEGTADALAKAARVTVTVPGATIELAEAQLAYVRQALARRAAPTPPAPANDSAILKGGATPVPADPAARAAADDAVALNQRAIALYGAGRMADARKAAEGSVAAAERAFGAGHAEVASRLVNLGMIVRRLGDNDAALVHYRRAIQILEPAGPSQALGVVLDNTGRILQERKEYDGGIAASTRAVEVLSAVLGPEHEHVGYAMNNLALLWDAKGDATRAAESCDRAVAILIKALGADNPRLRPFLEDQKTLRKRADRK